VAVDLADGRVKEARIALGGVATKPWRAWSAEQSLLGQPLTEATARRAGELALAGARTTPQNAFKVPLGVQTVVDSLMCAMPGSTRSVAKMGRPITLSTPSTRWASAPMLFGFMPGLAVGRS
jgi:hypothetical protein